MTFTEYFFEWMKQNKRDAVQDVTYIKYIDHYTSLKMTTTADNLKSKDLKDLTAADYQTIINRYAKTHERETVKGFHYNLRAAIRDAIDEGLIFHDCTRKVILKWKLPTIRKKAKYLSKEQLQRLISVLDLSGNINFDYFIYLTAKTGLRFAEGLGVVPESFDFANSKLSVTQTIKYKGSLGGSGTTFARTKTESSNRVIELDKETNYVFYRAVYENDLPDGRPIFEAVFTPNGHAINKYFNRRLENRCKVAGIPAVSIHGLRHTHASLLLYADVSVYSISKRLGHSKPSVTSNIYLHLINEMSEEDNTKMTNVLSDLD